MADVPTSPRKTMSSVSANARAPPTQKKPGAPKPKGAVRAKSGCYTCRIRRKKCDEQPNAEGACQTCVRLRLQCLGFGAKRPDWMRENNSVTELREKIKTFLASQGMIKGHSGSGPRSTEGDPPVLVLVENLQTSPPGNATPPTPTLSAGSNEPARQQQGPMTSYVRDPRDPSQYHHTPSIPPPDQHQHPYAPPSQQQQQTTWAPNLPELTSHPHNTHPDASMARGGQLLPSDILYSNQPNPILPSTSLVPPMSTSTASSSWPSSSGYQTSAYPSMSTTPSTLSAATGPNHMAVMSRVVPSPAMHSSFSPLYTANGYMINSDDGLEQSSPQEPIMSMPPQMRAFDTSIPYEQTSLVQHYMANVLPIQYLLSDTPSIKMFIYGLIQKYPSAREAACILANIHRERSGYSTGALNLVNTQTASQQFVRLISELRDKTQLDEGDAMAGLHAISTILFNGGRGAWEVFLNVAGKYVYSVLTNGNFYGPEEVMKKCSESTRFIIKTTMWFDVLASVTTQRVPLFLQTYRQLFDTTNQAYIEDPSAYGYNGMRRTPPETSMLPVMGCENNIVLAIAEISALACWKEERIKANALSIPQLVEKGMAIERKFINPGGPCSPSMFRPNMPHPELVQQPDMYRRSSHPNGGLGLNGMQAPMDSLRQPHGGMINEQAEVEISRSHTNDIFRASARLYLHTVLSGDYPSCPEIIESVTEVIHCLEKVPLERSVLSRSVLRSVVFGICIAGCLTQSPQQREFLTRLLDSQQTDRVGNLSEVKGLMQAVWTRRSHLHGQPVNWREVMRESQGELSMLLLV